jgi:hypothetical protein
MIAALLSIIRWPLQSHYLVEVYLTPHSSDSPCASHVLLAIKEHLVCGANSRWFNCSQMLSCKLTMIVHGPLGCLLLSVTFPCRERKLIACLVNFLLTSEFVQLKILLGWSLFVGWSPGWWRPLNCNVALNCADSSKRFSSQYCKIESACPSN